MLSSNVTSELGPKCCRAQWDFFQCGELEKFHRESNNGYGAGRQKLMELEEPGKRGKNWSWVQKTQIKGLGQMRN
jgi:hypothetical protein